MSTVRATLRLLAFGGYTAIIYSGWILSRLALFVSKPAALRAQSACFRAWARGAMRIFGVRVHAEGEPPSAPFFLVSNHLGYLDIPLIATRVPVFFVSKSEVAKWPVIGILAKSVNMIFVDRDRRSDVPRVVAEMERIREVGHGVVFFPEGTSSSGEGVMRFRGALFEASCRTGIPVYCVSISYATGPGDPPASTSVCWWGDMTFTDHFWNLLKLRRVDATLRFDPEPVPATAGDRIELANRARDKVAGLFIATTQKGGE